MKTISNILFVVTSFFVFNFAVAEDAQPNGRQREKVVSSIVVDEAAAKGSLTKDQIAKVIASFMGQIEYCYERQLQKEPNLSGKIRVHFVIDKLGKVAESSTMSSTMNSPIVESCINGVFRRMPFPPPGEGVVEATYPLIFSLKNESEPKEEKIEEKGIPAPIPVNAEDPKNKTIKDEIAKVIQASMKNFEDCYQRELANNTTLSGKIILWAMIGAKGVVTNVATEQTTLNSLPVELGLNYEFSKLKFSEVAKNKIIEVKYPFSFGLPKK